MLQKVLLILFGALVLNFAGCGHGRAPKVDYCVLDANHKWGLCHSSDDKNYKLEIPEMENFICLSPKHTERLLKACKKHRSALIDACLIDSQFEMLRCVSSDGASFDLSLSKADNFFCNSPKDFERLLKWCGAYE